MLKLTIIATLVLCLVLALIPHLVWGMAKIVTIPFHCRIRYAPFGKTALALVILLLLFFSYGYFAGRWRLQVNEIEFSHSNIPHSFDNFRIVHISDLHLGTFADNPEQLERIVDTINSLKPDLVCFTGDFVGIDVEEAEPFIGTLKRIESRYGVCSVLGNHDFFIYSHHGNSNMATDSLCRIQREELSWHLLRNESYKIKRGLDCITIVGVDNTNCAGQGFRTINKGNLKRAMNGTKGFRILLSHDPSHWRGEVLSYPDIPLTLSGHTHAAQISIFGWTPASLTFSESAGLYYQGEQALYVNIGLGCTIPVRIGATPEVTLIRLRET